MTREEATDNVRKIKNYMCAGNPIWDTRTIEQTVGMAIEALEQPEIIHCRECNLFGKPRCAMAWDDYDWAEPDGYCHLAERREEGEQE